MRSVISQVTAYAAHDARRAGHEMPFRTTRQMSQRLPRLDSGRGPFGRRAGHDGRRDTRIRAGREIAGRCIKSRPGSHRRPQIRGALRQPQHKGVPHRADRLTPWCCMEYKVVPCRGNAGITRGGHEFHDYSPEGEFHRPVGQPSAPQFPEVHSMHFEPGPDSQPEFGYRVVLQGIRGADIAVHGARVGPAALAHDLAVAGAAECGLGGESGAQ